MSRKKAQAKRRQIKDISSRLKMKGSASLNKQIEEELKVPDPDPNQSVGMGFGGTEYSPGGWGGPSPPHKIGGIPYEEIVARKRAAESEEEEEQHEDTE